MLANITKMNRRLLILVLNATLCVSCTSDMTKFDAVVSVLENEAIPLDTTVIFKVNDLDNPSSIESFDGQFIRTEMIGITWVHKTQDDFIVFIQTNIAGHGGTARGYAYSKKGRNSNWDIYGGREVWWRKGGQINANWWDIYWKDEG